MVWKQINDCAFKYYYCETPLDTFFIVKEDKFELTAFGEKHKFFYLIDAKNKAKIILKQKLTEKLEQINKFLLKL